MADPKSEVYTFKIPKNNRQIDFKDLELWIADQTKGKWSKRTLKHSVIYTFSTVDDAFKFKLRWTFS